MIGIDVEMRLVDPAQHHKVRYDSTRVSGKRNRGAVQFFHSGLGPVAARPVVDGDCAVLSGGNSLVYLARLGHPSLVDFGRCAFQTSWLMAFNFGFCEPQTLSGLIQTRNNSQSRK
jgi:hypothetical protein